MRKMRVKASLKGDKTEVKILVTHPMETGQRKDKKTGKFIEAHYIEEVLCEHQGELVLRAFWSGGVSENPYTAFSFAGGAKDDEVKVSWKDNKGESGSMATKIK